MAIKHRRGAGGDDGLPLVRKEARNGSSVKPYKPKSRQKMKFVATCVKYLSYAIIFLVIVLVLILRFDTSDRVRHKMVDLKNRVLGNTQKYDAEPIVSSLFAAVSKGAVNDNYVVFCTVSNLQQDETHVSFGKSPVSPEAALKIAQSKLPRKTNKYPYVKIDIVTGVKRFEDYNYYNEFDKIPSRWFGLALNWDTDWVFSAEEVHHNALVDKHRFIRWERLALYAAKSGRSEGALALPDFGDDGTTIDYVDIFHTESVFIDMSKKEQFKLFHGHRLYETLSPSLLWDRANATGAYLAQIVKDTGRQVYRYNPRSDYEPFGYNLNRHAGTLYAMARIFRSWQDSYLKVSMSRTLAYLKQSVQDCPLPLSPEKKAKCCVDFETKDKLKMANLGVNALTILAIVEYVDAVKPDDTNDLLKLASHIAEYVEGSIRMVGDHVGSLVHKIHLSNDNTLLDIDKDFYVRYFHGEVAFALARMVFLAQKNSWTDILAKKDELLRMANSAISNLVKIDSQEPDKDFTFDHWLLYGISEMNAVGYEIPPEFVKHAVRSVQVVSKYQNGIPDEKIDFDDVDRLGIYYDDLSSIATATKSEGLCAIIDLLEKKGEDWKVAFDAAALSVRYQLQTQYQPEVAMYLRNPQRILGGFHSSILASDLRNDFSQHNLCSLICMANIMEKKGMKVISSSTK